MFDRARLDVTFLPAVARDERLARLRTGDTDLALMDLASFVDTVATEPGFPARCVMVVTQRLPMAAHHVADRDVAGALVRAPHDLLRARFGAPAGSAFESEHRALLRRLREPASDLHVDLPYGEVFQALDAGWVDVVPDYAGIAPRFRRILGAERHAMIRYRDCGVRAYGMGLLATRSALERHPERIATFLKA
ncbi:MAG: ABC transporter substrate-binding protein, partial [Actinomycetota bacterium]|nr:ABC transporter substrate-binding protein [Actinomycetota bacterium]